MSQLGQKQTLEWRAIYVRFTPKSGRSAEQKACPLCAKTGSRQGGDMLHLALPSLPRMVHLRFSTDPAEVSASRHPNAQLFSRSRPETDHRAQ